MKSGRGSISRVDTVGVVASFAPVLLVLRRRERELLVSVEWFNVLLFHFNFLLGGLHGLGGRGG